jgi:hypothetical protein
MSQPSNWLFGTVPAAGRKSPLARVLFLVGFCFPLAAAALELPVESRVKNVGSYCTWASLDTLARANGVEQLRGVMEERRRQHQSLPDPGYDETIEAELKTRGVKYELRPQWSFDRDLLECYAATHGVAVSLMSGNPWSIGCHTIVVTRYDEDWVEFYDSSKPIDANQRPKIWRCGRDWFDQWWLGSSVVVFPGGDSETTSG